MAVAAWDFRRFAAWEPKTDINIKRKRNYETNSKTGDELVEHG
jgi:hypothetical protein